MTLDDGTLSDVIMWFKFFSALYEHRYCGKQILIKGGCYETAKGC